MMTFMHIGIIFVFFTLLYFVFKRPFKKSYIIAIIFLFMLAVPSAFRLIMLKARPFPPQEYFSPFKSFLFTFGPLLYLYVKFEIIKCDVLKKIHLLHFLPFIFFTIWQFTFPIPEPMTPVPLSIIKQHSEEQMVLDAKPMVNEISIDVILNERTSADEQLLAEKIENDSPAAKFFKFSGLLSFIIYSFIIFKFISYYKNNNKKDSSVDLIFHDLKRLQWLTISFVFSYSFVLITALTTRQKFMDPLRDRLITPEIATCFFTIAFCFFIVTQSFIFTKSIRNQNESVTDKKDKKYERSGLKDSVAEYYLKILQEFMNTNKPYLNSDLTITDLSEKIKIPRHYLTQIINEKLNKNFFTYITEYRINEVKQIMSDENCSDYTILRIAYQSGFNSKSKFNSAFKKFTGNTPSEYKKNLTDKINQDFQVRV